MDEKRISTITYSSISSRSMKVVINYDDGTSHTDYPVWCDYTNHSDVSYDYPELIPSAIQDAIRSIFEYTRDYERHYRTENERLFASMESDAVFDDGYWPTP